jgi:hypothetical protein
MKKVMKKVVTFLLCISISYATTYYRTDNTGDFTILSYSSDESQDYLIHVLEKNIVVKRDRKSVAQVLPVEVTVTGAIGKYAAWAYYDQSGEKILVNTNHSQNENTYHIFGSSNEIQAKLVSTDPSTFSSPPLLLNCTNFLTGATPRTNFFEKSGRFHFLFIFYSNRAKCRFGIYILQFKFQPVF